MDRRCSPLNDVLYRVWLSDAHFTDWDDLETNIILFGDMTIDEIKKLVDVALVRGYEIFVMRQVDGEED